MNKKYNITMGNCTIKLKELGDQSIDAIITDPPYLYLPHKLDKPFDESLFF